MSQHRKNGKYFITKQLCNYYVNKYLIWEVGMNMKGGVALFTFVLICLVQCEARSVEMKHYTIDLSISPEQRWRHVLSDYNSSVPLVIDYFQSMVTTNCIAYIYSPLFRCHLKRCSCF